MTLYINVHYIYIILYLIRIHTYYIYTKYWYLSILFDTFFGLPTGAMAGNRPSPVLLIRRASALSVDCRRVSTAAVWSWGRVAALITASSSSSSCFWDDSWMIWISDWQFLDSGLDLKNSSSIIQLLGYLQLLEIRVDGYFRTQIRHWRMRLKF